MKVHLVTAITAITAFQSLYLIYMYFLFETKYDFDNAPFDRAIQSLGGFFKHSSSSDQLTAAPTAASCDWKNKLWNDGAKENKICDMGRVVAAMMVLFWGVRSSVVPGTKLAARFVRWSYRADIVCILVAYLLNLNALFYALPVVFGEAFVLHSLSGS